MFSATFSEDIRKLAKGLVNNPVEISVSPRNTTVKSVEQWICPVDKGQKSRLLCHLINDNQWHQVLVFSRTKHGANKLVKQLEATGLKAAAIHGNKSQGARTKALANFKDNTVQVLVATDIAARGIDIDQLPYVINFDLPNIPEDYVHRIGRTGRANSTGHAISLVCLDEFEYLSDIEHLTSELIERRIVEGFEPVHDLPPSSLTKRHKHQKRKPQSSGNRLGNRGKQQASGSANMPSSSRRRRKPPAKGPSA